MEPELEAAGGRQAGARCAAAADIGMLDRMAGWPVIIYGWHRQGSA